MLYSIALLALVGLVNADELTYKTVAWEGKRDATGKAYTQGSAFVCKKQPRTLQGVTTCHTNADCGSSLCIHMEIHGTKGKQCGCGDFERRFDHNYVTICTCRWTVDNNEKNIGTCLPIWRNTIMCKFACQNCFNCAEKNEAECAKDGTCKMDKGLCTLAVEEEVCYSTGANRAACEALHQCRFQHNGSTHHAGKCVPRTFIETISQGPNKNCPVGTNRMRDRYQNPANGTYFDVCVKAYGPAGSRTSEIKKCRLYEWDGDSCKECEPTFKLATVALDRGNGRLKDNAICIAADNVENKNCEVFKYDHDAVMGAGHHYCVRCKEKYRYEFSGHHITQGKCILDKITIGDTVALDMRLILGFSAVAMALTIYLAISYRGLSKGELPTESSPATDRDVDISITN